MRSIETQLLAYLLNSLWQVPLVFAAAWIAARAVRRSGPAMEHRVWVAALAFEALLPACSITPGQLVQSLAQVILWQWGSHAVGGTVSVKVTSGAAFTHSLLRLPPQLFTAIALTYAGVVAYGAARLFLGLWKTTAMRRQSQPVVLTGAAARTWARCSHQFGVHDAQVAVSRVVPYPMTMGLRRRLVLLPAELPAALVAEDLDAAIAHEFAHMQRRDFAKNLVYAFLSLPIAYHPLLWLTRVRVEETREMVCDAMAADAIAGPQKYARSLLRLASLLAHGTPDRPLHAIGILDANIFERRVMNLTQKRVELRRAQRLATAALCIVIGLGTCASALALRMNVAAPSAQTDGQPASEVSVAVSVPRGVMATNRLTEVQPVYPPEAKAAKISGTVILKARIGKDGAIESLQLVSGPEELTKSAWYAVKQWTYKPYLLNGEPTAVDTTITVNFSLAN
jgi:TonB family protein